MRRPFLRSIARLLLVALAPLALPVLSELTRVTDKGEDLVLALGSKSGEITGAVSYLERDGLLRFSPSRDFAPGETVTVTLDLSKLRGPGGKAGSGKVSTTFLVPVARG